MQAARASHAGPTCSVVIAAYNAASTIAQTLDSVLAQTCKDFEVIVVDDGSSDDTAARVHHYLADSRVRLHHQPNSGPSPARNAGISLASGEYVCILDSDDLWLPCYLEVMVGALEQAPDTGFAFTKAWILERAANKIRKDVYSKRVPDVPPRDPASWMLALVNVNFVMGLIVARREVLGQVGGYDPELTHAEDYDLCLRILGAGYRATYVPGPLVVVSDRSDSHSKDARGMLLGRRRAFAKLVERQGLRPDVTALARRRLAEVEREIQMLEGERAQPPWLLPREALARSTRGWRQRRARRSAPPPEVAAGLPGVGCGSAAWPDATGHVDLTA